MRAEGRAPSSPASSGAPAAQHPDDVEVVVQTLAGEVVFGPARVDAVTSIASFRRRLEGPGGFSLGEAGGASAGFVGGRCGASRPEAVHLLHGPRRLGDDERFADAALELEAGDTEIGDRVDPDGVPLRRLRLTAIRTRVTYQVFAWGDARRGGSTSLVAGQLSSGVLSVHSTDSAFAALKDTGQVVIWGDTRFGGHAEREDVAAALAAGGFEEVKANSRAFAAKRSDGKVVAWGDPASGGDAPPGLDLAADPGGNSLSLSCSPRAFAALVPRHGSGESALGDTGGVICWGHADFGGDSAAVESHLRARVEAVFGTDVGFVAVKADGTLVFWGHPDACGPDRHIVAKLDRSAAAGSGDLVRAVVGNRHAFVVIASDGGVHAFGDALYGGCLDSVASELRAGVVCVRSTPGAFAALLECGRVVAWGAADAGGDASEASSAIAQGGGAARLWGSDCAGEFIAVTASGAVVPWGRRTGSRHCHIGGPSGRLRSHPTQSAVAVVCSGVASAALMENGTVTAWGMPGFGGEVPAEPWRWRWTAGRRNGATDEDLGGRPWVVGLCSTSMAFAGLLRGGGVVAWGSQRFGGSIPPPLVDELSSGVAALRSNGGAFLALKPCC